MGAVSNLVLFRDVDVLLVWDSKLVVVKVLMLAVLHLFAVLDPNSKLIVGLLEWVCVDLFAEQGPVVQWIVISCCVVLVLVVETLVLVGLVLLYLLGVWNMF